MSLLCIQLLQIHRHMYALTMCPMWADAGEMVNEVNAGSSMKAGLRVAFIHLIFTVYALVAWLTLNQFQKERSTHGTRNSYEQMEQKWSQCTYYALICAQVVNACCSVTTWV